MPHDDIVWIEAEDYCARIHLRDRTVLVRESLRTLVKELSDAGFVRVHRSERTGREISIGAVYATLERLEAKGYVSSFTGEPTAERGGRAKRHFEIEAAGHEALNASQNALKNMSAGLSRRWKRA